MVSIGTITIPPPSPVSAPSIPAENAPIATSPVKTRRDMGMNTIDSHRVIPVPGSPSVSANVRGQQHANKRELGERTDGRPSRTQAHWPNHHQLLSRLRRP